MEKKKMKGKGQRTFQTLLFSATFPRALMARCRTWLVDERVVDIEKEKDLHLAESHQHKGGTKKGLASLHKGGGRLPVVSKNIRQIVQVCAEHKKGRKLLKYLASVRTLAREEGQRHAPKMLIFVNTIKKARFLYNFLKQNDAGASSKDHSKGSRGGGGGVESKLVMFHGKRSQRERTQAMQDFKGGKVGTMVATDIAGRGIHVPGLKHVVLYDFPPSLEQYVHRVGRTGRQQEEGESLAFFTRNLAPLAPDMVRLLQAHGQKVDPYLAECAKAAIKAREEMEKVARENGVGDNGAGGSGKGKGKGEDAKKNKPPPAQMKKGNGNRKRKKTAAASES